MNRRKPFRTALRRLALGVPPIRRIHDQLQQTLVDNAALRSERDSSRAAHEVSRAELEAVKADRNSLRAAAPLLAVGRNPETDGAARRAPTNAAFAIVGSAGRTATQWLADAFNLHDDVFFSHGPDVHPRKLGADDSRQDIFLRIIAEMSSFPFQDVDAYFDLLEGLGRYRVYGNVHGIEPTNPYLYPKNYRRNYFACAVVRNPVRRIESFINRWRYEISVTELRRTFYLTDYREANSALLAALARDYAGRELADTELLFIQAADVTFRYDRTHVDAGMPVFTMERLVSDRDHFLGLFAAATAGRVEITDAYVQRLQQLAAIDARGDSERSAMSLYQSWDRWMQAYFRDRVAELGLAAPYASLGYDLSFLPRRAGPAS